MQDQLMILCLTIVPREEIPVVLCLLSPWGSSCDP